MGADVQTKVTCAGAQWLAQIKASSRDASKPIQDVESRERIVLVCYGQESRKVPPA